MSSGSSEVTKVTRAEVSNPTEGDHASLALEVDSEKIKETKKIKNHNHTKRNKHNNNDHAVSVERRGKKNSNMSCNRYVIFYNFMLIN